jgi:polysaccharide export outer membrane protein
MRHGRRDISTGQNTMRTLCQVGLIGALIALAPAAGRAQTTTPPAAMATPAAAAGAGAVVVPADYVIGPDDVLGIVFWRDKDMTADVIVRPDGKITLPLVNDIQAAGLTPEQLRTEVEREANRFVTDANATVIVKQINSRRVYITGQVTKPGPYAISAPMTVLQLIAMAGGLTEFADQENIIIWRTQAGQQVSFAFNYKAVSRRRNLNQNVVLKPGDTVLVP